MRASRNLSRSLALLPFLAAVALPAEAAVYISTQPTSNMSCSGGTCTPTAQPANLNATDLAHMLASGDVSVTTLDGSQKYIIVKSSFGWASAHRLTLYARDFVTIEAPVVVSGPGGLTVTNNGNYTNGLSFGPTGRVLFRDLSSNFVMKGKTFQLVSDIGSLASAVATQPAGTFALAGDVKSTTAYSTSPIPTTFTGKFEGLGNRIFYLRISDTAPNQHDGLFATVEGSVAHLGLVKAKVEGTSGSSIGTLAGVSNGDIEGAYSTGMVLHTGSGGSLGGLVGSNGDYILNSYSEASVRGQDNVSAGGLAGTNGGEIDHTRASGGVTGGKNATVGGLAGTNSLWVFDSQSSGAVSAGSTSLAGGLVGQGSGGIFQSFATGAVSVGNLGTAGGLLGRYFEHPKDETQIIESYATGSVTGLNAELGSLFGECCNTTQYTVLETYGTGAVSGMPHAIIGGVVGDDHAPQTTWRATYWDTDTTGVSNLGQGAGNIANDPGLTGLSDAQLKSVLPAGFDSAKWGQSASINNGYPYLLDNPPQ